MEKRIILALVLSLLVLFLYQQFVVPWVSPPPAKKVSSDKDAPEDARRLEGSAHAIKQEEPISAHRYAEETVTAETPLYKAVFSSKGGGVKSWVLKNYKEDLKQTSSNVEMITPVLDEYPLEDRLIKDVVSSVRQAHDEVVYFKPSRTNISLNPGQKEEFVFTWQSPDGIGIEKRYAISANTYSIQVETTVSNTSPNPFEGRLVTGIASSIKFLQKRGGTYHQGPVLYSDGNILTKDIKQGSEMLTGKIGWAGLEEMYFMSALIPKKIENAKWSSITAGDLVKIEAAIPLNLTPGASATIGYTAYIGPKEMNILKAQGAHLDDSINYGWFPLGRTLNKAMAKPMHAAMNFLYAYIHNYGLVIILLTVVIKILFHPLTKKGLDSMKEMQRIQPQVAALREKYKDDKEKMNRELMDLYKRYSINPLGGCLPTVLQIPVFIALYNVLSTSMELRHAPFAFWLYDLSAKDPYYVTPILMGATMLIQQKMTPSAMDPVQAKMMLIMPVVFTFMFLSFPSGLVIYWLVNNVLSIAQQYYIQKTTK
ncbi:MAG: membrane protein insertase YidC [Deltaproteobacteria bacterium]|nr:membrane protein insertase YidC [Deltaproteobacteria bacterium]